jgi:intraflagellar transport protein 74
MDRPASRGLLAGGVSKAPTGLAIDRPERPSTASRQQQPMQAATVQRMGTASTRGGAGAASGGGVLGPPPGTAFRRVLGGGAAGAQAQAADQAQARPLTAQQGIGLQKPMTAGSGRQVLDRTYFLNELRQKRQQVFNTISQMRVSAEGPRVGCDPAAHESAGVLGGAPTCQPSPVSIPAHRHVAAVATA